MTYSKFTTELTNMGATLEKPKSSRNIITITLVKGLKQVIVDIMDHESKNEEFATIWVDLADDENERYSNKAYDYYTSAMKRIKRFLA